VALAMLKGVEDAWGSHVIDLRVHSCCTTAVEIPGPGTASGAGGD
jgi:hypothetical protein